VKRLLVLGRDHREVAAILAADPLGRELEIADRGFDEVTRDELERAEMLLAFRVPPALASASHPLANLRFAQSTGAGVDGLLAGGAIPLHVPIARVLGVFGAPMAEYVLLRCLAIAQDLPRLLRAQREQRFEPFYSRLLRDLEIAIVGIGEIGLAIARVLASHGARPIGVSRTGRDPDPADSAFARCLPIDALDDLLPQLDVAVIVVPDTAATRGLFGARRLARMKSSAWIVNVARGSVIDEDALADALRDGRLGGAALDVFREEPLPRTSPLWSLPNVLLSPHVAGLTTPQQAAQAFLGNYARIRRGEAPLGVVDRERGY
jgi:glyoxylate/hydroxypyruvate reductase A